VLQSPESLECLSFSDALHSSMGGSSSGIDVGDDADTNSLFGEFRQLFAENAETPGAPPPPELAAPMLEPPSGGGALKGIPLKGTDFGVSGISFSEGQGLGGNISLTEINSASLNEILGSRSFNDLGATLSFSQSQKYLKDANASDLSISSYLDRASSAFVQSEGLREIMYEFVASL